MNEAERFLREQMNRQGASHSAPNAAPPPPSPQDHFNPAWAQANAYAAPTSSGPQRQVTMGEAFKRFWTRWTCQGRASRSEFWLAQLALFLIVFGVLFMLGFLARIAGNADTVALVPILTWVWVLATLIPNSCLSVRRLHDTGHSGWYYFLLLIPDICLRVYRLHDTGYNGWCYVLGRVLIVGWLLLLIWLCRASEPHENQYGPVPNCE